MLKIRELKERLRQLELEAIEEMKTELRSHGEIPGVTQVSPTVAIVKFSAIAGSGTWNLNPQYYNLSAQVEIISQKMDKLGSLDKIAKYLKSLDKGSFHPEILKITEKLISEIES